MKMLKRYFHYMIGLMAIMATACSSNDATEAELSMPEGMGRIRITIATPESNPDLTRAVSDTTWLAPDHDWERLRTFRILICDATNKVVQIITGDDSMMGEASTSSTEHQYKQSAELLSEPLLAGSYKIYATANCHSSSNENDVFDDGYTVGSTVDWENTTIKLANGYSEKNIPMTGRLANAVTVTPGDVTDAGTITVWRVMGKMQFEFANFTSSQMKIIGIEVEPINQISTGDDSGKGLVYLFSKDDLTSTANLAARTGVTIPESARTNVGTVRYVPTEPLTLDAKDGTTTTGNLFFYVNETDATFTTTSNQLSVRFKIKRQKAGDEWYDEELRYGVTTHYNGTSGGFNVIRRNDWVHIPVYLRDWTFRIEAMPFVPIAGYPAVVVGNDALEATFSTGGYVILQPFAQKNNDGVWRDCSDSEVTFVSLTSAPQAGSANMMTTPFTYDPDTKCIIGVLNNNLDAGTYRTTLTIDMKLGPQGSQFDYTFTCNVILQK